MKYCQYCGEPIEHDQAVICVKCGCPIPGVKVETSKEENKAIDTLIIVFMWISTGFLALATFGIALAWCLPMTLTVQGRIKNKQKIGVGMGVCTLLFVSLISGILILVKDEC